MTRPSTFRKSDIERRDSFVVRPVLRSQCDRRAL